MDTNHPLSLPEIVLIIGKFIPLWVPEQHEDEMPWSFQPKDLLAAISVNRLFNTVLTPLLFTVYVEPFPELPNNTASVAIYTLPSTFHIRFLDLSRYLPHCSGKLDPAQLNCTRLQELRLSSYVDTTCARQLIQANPGLRVLAWESCHEILPEEAFLDLKSALSLNQLRYLGLHSWKLAITCLYDILRHNAEHLEEVRLEDCDSFVSQATKQSVSLSAPLPMAKTLQLDVDDNELPQSIYDLVPHLPALETIVVSELRESTAKELGETLRKYCPNLRTIKSKGIRNSHTDSEDLWGDGMAYLAGACAPGKLVNASLDGWSIGDELVCALVLHKDGLETLELTVRDSEYVDSFENLGRILEQCHRLKHLSVYFFGATCGLQRTLLFLDKLMMCQDLKSLALRGFEIDSNEDLNSDDSDYGIDSYVWEMRKSKEQRAEDDEELRRKIRAEAGKKERWCFTKSKEDYEMELERLIRKKQEGTLHIRSDEDTTDTESEEESEKEFDEDDDEDDEDEDEDNGYKDNRKKKKKSNKDSRPPPILLPVWRKVPYTDQEYRRIFLNDDFKDLICKAVSTLPALKHVVINSDKFEMSYSPIIKKARSRGGW